MRTIYIDTEFKCHTRGSGTVAVVETDFFDGKCDTFVEGYRFIPEGESWTRDDGVTFHGQMVAPWKPFDELERAQVAHERHLLAEYTEALKTLGVEV